MIIPASKRFLTAEWRYLVMLNYQVDPQLLQPFVPLGTELDSFNGKTLVSVVGFLFLNTRVLGIGFPRHRNFEEVNLRFYVRRDAPDGVRRGVVFIKEIVPRYVIAGVARLLYGEKYIATPMRSRLEQQGVAEDRRLELEYAWRSRGRWNHVHALGVGEPATLREGSEEEFITEHFWGYSRTRRGGTIEYQVEHPRWNVWKATESEFSCDVASIYGPEFAEPLSAAPDSAFIADGSQIAVYRGTRIA
jgi:uncharacterized protein YqjF (DUF2071 family)